MPVFGPPLHQSHQISPNRTETFNLSYISHATCPTNFSTAVASHIIHFFPVSFFLLASPTAVINFFPLKKLSNFLWSFLEIFITRTFFRVGIFLNFFLIFSRRFFRRFFEIFFGIFFGIFFRIFFGIFFQNFFGIFLWTIVDEIFGIHHAIFSGGSLFAELRRVPVALWPFHTRQLVRGVTGGRVPRKRGIRWRRSTPIVLPLRPVGHEPSWDQ